MGNKLLFIIAGLTISASKVLAGDTIRPRKSAFCGYGGNQIYCYGGDTSVTLPPEIDNNMYSLNIHQFSGQSTDLMNNKWETIKSSVPFNTELRRGPTAIVLSDGKRILIQGGQNPNKTKFVNQTIIFDTTTNTWQKALPYTEAERGTRQIFFASAVNLPNNLVGFYGGIEEYANISVPQISTSNATMPYDSGNNTYVGFSSLRTYSPESKGWKVFSPQNNFPVNYYPNTQTATFDPASGKIYYLGGGYSTPGVTGEVDATFTWAYTFNTKYGTWLNESFGGEVPNPRNFHTANLMPNSRDIILYGGSEDFRNPSSDYCFTLNLIDNTWTKQKNVNVPPILGGPRYTHSSVLVNTTLFILFGRGMNDILITSLITIDVANIANITYTPIFNAPTENAILPTINNTTDNNIVPPSSNLSKSAIGGIAAGSAVVFLLIIAAIVYRVRRKRNLQLSKADDNQVEEEIPVDWDKIEEEYREVLPVNSNFTNYPDSKNPTDVTSKGVFSNATISTSDPTNINVVKLSVENAEKGCITIKPDAN